MDKEFKRILKSPIGKWLYVPFFIAVAVIVAIGLIATLLRVADRLPQWAFTAPAAPVVVLYYVLMARREWAVHIRGQFTTAKGGVAVGTQRNAAGAIAPIVHGTAVIHVNAPPIPPAAQSILPPPSTPAPLAPPATSPPPPITEQNRVLPEKLLDQEVKVPGADLHAFELDLVGGDVLEGSFTANAPLSVYIMSERAYLEYWQTRDPGASKCLVADESAGQIRWKVPRDGKWRLVLDTFGKQSPRKVRIYVRKVAPAPATTV